MFCDWPVFTYNLHFSPFFLTIINSILFSVLVLLGCSAFVFTLILRRVHKHLLTTKNHDQSVEQRHYQDVLLITGGLVSSLGW